MHGSYAEFALIFFLFTWQISCLVCFCSKAVHLIRQRILNFVLRYRLIFEPIVKFRKLKIRNLLSDLVNSTNIFIFIYLVDFVSCLFLLQSCELTHVTLGFSHYLSSACRRKNIIYKIIKIPNTKLYCSFDIMKGKSRLVLDLYTKEMKY